MFLKFKDTINILLLSTGIFLFVIDLFIVNVSLRSITQALGMSNSEAQGVIILYVIGYASVLISAGKLGINVGRKKIYLIGMAGFTCSSLLCGCANSIVLLLTGRLLQGLSAGFMVPQGISFIPVLFTNRARRSWAMGLYGSIAGLASVVGQLLGGILPDVTWIPDSWRLIFLINVPIGIGAWIAIYQRLPEVDRVRSQCMDVTGMMTLFLLLIGGLTPLILGPEHQWPSWTLYMLFITILSLLIFLAFQQKRSKQGLDVILDLRPFQKRVFLIGLLTAVCYYMVQDAYFIINSLHLQDMHGFTPTHTGVAFVFQGVGYVLASLTVNRLVARLGKYMVLIGLFVMVCGLIGHLYLFDAPHPCYVHICFLFFFYGLGCGTVLPALMTLALQDMNAAEIGIASGLYLTVQQVAICLGIAFVVGIYLYASQEPITHDHYVSKAYVYSTICSVGLLLLVMLFMSIIPFVNQKQRKTAMFHTRAVRDRT